MRINFMMAPLALCLIATLATPASARHRNHTRHHPMQAQAFQPFQPMMTERPDGPVMQPAMMQASAMAPAGTPAPRMRRSRGYQAQASFNGPSAGGSLV